MSHYQPIETIPKDGSWILLRGRNTAGKRMIPVVAAYMPPGRPAGRSWVDSGSYKSVDDLVAYTAPTADGKPDWAPLPE